MPSSRCLFRLVPSEPPTDETGCSSSQGVLLQTPTTVQTDEPPEKMRARAEKNGYKNGTKFGSLTSQIKYDERVKELLPTPLTGEYRDSTLTENNAMKGLQDNLSRIVSRAYLGINKDGSKMTEQELVDARAMIFPTPTAIEGVKWTNTWNPNSQMGQSLSAMAGSGMLPTPFDWKLNGGMLPTPRTMEVVEKPEAQAKRLHDRTGNQMNNIQSAAAFGMLDPMTPDSLKTASQDADAGKTSRLSPLFTEEMMGFPLMWTALPFLSESGAPKPSKPTATPSSPK